MHKHHMCKRGVSIAGCGWKPFLCPPASSHWMPLHSALTGWSPVTAPFSVLPLKPQGPEYMSGSWVEHPALTTLVRVSSSPGRQSLLTSPLEAGWGSLTLLHKSASLSHVRYSGLGFVSFVFLPKHIVLFLCYCVVMFILETVACILFVKRREIHTLSMQRLLYISNVQISDYFLSAVKKHLDFSVHAWFSYMHTSVKVLTQ